MIGWLQGNIVDKDSTSKVILNVHGVGYDVEISMQTFFKIEAETGTIGLYIHTIVREDAFLLFGFLDKAERGLFRALIKVNGVGPKVAMNILSSVSVLEYVHAIQSKNLNFLTKLPGIGKKTAERLLIEMKESVLSLVQSDVALGGGVDSLPASNIHQQTEAISALEASAISPRMLAKRLKKLMMGQRAANN